MADLQNEIGSDLSECINNGNIDRAMSIIQRLNKMDVEIKFTVSEKPNHPFPVRAAGIYAPPVIPKLNNAQQQMREALMQFGYSEAQVEFAIARTSSVEAAAELLLSTNFQ